MYGLDSEFPNFDPIAFSDAKFAKSKRCFPSMRKKIEFIVRAEIRTNADTNADTNCYCRGLAPRRDALSALHCA